MPNGTRDISPTPPHGPAGSNGEPGGNGQPVALDKLPYESHKPRPDPPAPRSPFGRLIHYASIGLIVVFAIAIPVSIPYLKRDPIIWDMTILFTGVTGAACGATAGIALVVFGGARRQRWMVAAGVAVGIASFVVLGVTITWALGHGIPGAKSSSAAPPPRSAESIRLSREAGRVRAHKPGGI